MHRPVRRWCHSVTDLQNFALITWSVDPDRLKRVLPDEFEPVVRDGHAFVSMVPFADRRFHFRFAPFATLSCGQVNYRTYVRYRGEEGVWFFATSLDSMFVKVPQALWKMPWQRTRIRIAAEWGPDGCETWSMTGKGPGLGAEVSMRGTGRPLQVDAGVSPLLVDPFVGWYSRTDGSGTGRYSVWHEPLILEEAAVDDIRCDLFVGLGLIEPERRPVSAGVQRSTTFDIHTPPVRD